LDAPVEEKLEMLMMKRNPCCPRCLCEVKVVQDIFFLNQQDLFLFARSCIFNLV
jgi:hypothetical protein